MNRFAYWVYRLLYTLKEWLLRRFTIAGVFMLVLLAAAAIFGFDTTLAMTFQVFTLAAAVLLIAYLLSTKLRIKIHIQRDLPRFATAGQSFRYDASITSYHKKAQADLFINEEFKGILPSAAEFGEHPPGIRRRHPFAQVRGYTHWVNLADRKRGTSRTVTPLPVLRPKTPQRVRLSMVPTRRGRIQLTGMRVTRPDPFGLCRAQMLYSLPQSITVLPRRYVLPPIHLPGERRHHSGGIALTSSVGDAEEFVALREYRPGDPLRKIHWKSWAKTGKPIVRECQEEYFVRHVLILDTFLNGDAGPAFEEAVSLAASFACTVQTQESLLDLIFVGLQVYCFTAGRGLGQTDRILEVLSAVQPCREKPFQSILPSILSRADSWSGCICIFLEWNEPRQNLVQLLRQMNLPVLALVVSEADSPAELDPGPMEDAVQDFHVLRAGEIEKGLAQL